MLLGVIRLVSFRLRASGFCRTYRQAFPLDLPAVAARGEQIMKEEGDGN